MRTTPAVSPELKTCRAYIVMYIVTIFPMLKRVDCDAPIATILPVALAPLYVSVPLRRCLSVPEVGIWPPCAVTIAIRVCATINDLQLVRIRDEEVTPRHRHNGDALPPRGSRLRPS